MVPARTEREALGTAVIYCGGDLTARPCNQTIVGFVCFGFYLFIYLFIYTFFYSFLGTNRQAKANHRNDGDEQRAWKKC